MALRPSRSEDIDFCSTHRLFRTGCRAVRKLRSLVLLVSAVLAIAPGVLEAQTARTAGFRQSGFAIVRATVVPRPGEMLRDTDILIRLTCSMRWIASSR